MMHVLLLQQALQQFTSAAYAVVAKIPDNKNAIAKRFILASIASLRAERENLRRMQSPSRFQTDDTCFCLSFFAAQQVDQTPQLSLAMCRTGITFVRRKRRAIFVSALCP
jgi:hypothetical protein